METIKKQTISELLQLHPFLGHFFDIQNLDIKDHTKLTLPQLFDSLGKDYLQEHAIQPQQFFESIEAYIQQKHYKESAESLESITIFAGKNKSGEKENFKELIIYKGEIISIVGRTGSGKSQLLSDIEWMAQEDTLTSRKIFINGKAPDIKLRFSISDKLVAQLSQNMNFVMDISVEEFLVMHAESRMIYDSDVVTEKILAEANLLAGEQFTADTPVSSLSGGQSRALMIADTAFLSSSPIVLIDEIENAGINRRKALDLLLSNDKIVLMATHDPVLALMCEKRLVIKNGGIVDIITTTEDEKKIFAELEIIDKRVVQLKDDLRDGKKLS